MSNITFATTTGTGTCLNCGAQLTEMEQHLRFCQHCKLRWVDNGTTVVFNRCCHRCDETGDTCVSGKTCTEHGVLGCEICFGERGEKIFVKKI